MFRSWRRRRRTPRVVNSTLPERVEWLGRFQVTPQVVGRIKLGTQPVGRTLPNGDVGSCAAAAAVSVKASLHLAHRALEFGREAVGCVEQHDRVVGRGIFVLEKPLGRETTGRVKEQ